MMQMTSHRREQRILMCTLIASFFLTLLCLSLTTVRQRHGANSSFLWSFLDNLSVNLFSVQPRNTSQRHTQPAIRGPLGVAVQLQPPCPGKIDNDELDMEICRPLLAGSRSTTARPNWTAISSTDYAIRTDRCDCFRSDFGYFVSPEDTTDEERSFPIAFSLLTYENLEQTERLLRLVYRPHNIYCIHVDAKSSTELHAGLEMIAKCLDNVFIAKPAISVEWGQISVVHAELLCMRQLLDNHKHWKYFINLVGRDFPLRTNYELVKILDAYKGSNDVQASRSQDNHFFPDWFKHSWTADGKRGPRKDPAPHGFDVAKGSTHIAVTREFVEFAVNDRKAQDLLSWMRDIKIPDEHFFQTLNHSPQMNVPGSFLGDPDMKESFVRFKFWVWYEGVPLICHGQWIRFICNIGVGDLKWVVARPHMFINKLRIEQDPSTFRCLELWYRTRVRRQRHLANETFNVSIYASQPFVRDHVSQLRFLSNDLYRLTGRKAGLG